MKRTVFCCLALVFSVAARGLAQAPRVSAVFSNSNQGPSFMVECTNTSSAPARAIELVTQTRIKVDGQELGGAGGGSVGAGSLEPGKTWKVLIVLSQGTGSPSADLGQRLGKTISFPLMKGQHRIAVRCLGNWSEESEFYWDGTPPPK